MCRPSALTAHHTGRSGCSSTCTSPRDSCIQPLGSRGPRGIGATGFGSRVEGEVCHGCLLSSRQRPTTGITGFEAVVENQLVQVTEIAHSVHVHVLLHGIGRVWAVVTGVAQWVRIGIRLIVIGHVEAVVGFDPGPCPNLDSWPSGSRDHRRAQGRACGCWWPGCSHTP